MLRIWFLSLLQLAMTFAWGQVGHEMVATLAYKRLDANAQKAIQQIILGNESSTDNETSSSSSPLAAVANWADRVRYTKEYHWTIPLHFVDVRDDSMDGGCHPANNSRDETTTTPPLCCTFNYSRDCEKDMCVAGAIANYSRYITTIDEWEHNPLFQGNDKNNGIRNWHIKESLMFVTHFVGDIHQPLHCGRKSDKGGNTIHVTFNVTDKNNNNKSLRGSSPMMNHEWNLHSIWDDGIIDQALMELYSNSREKFEDDLGNLIQEAERTGVIKLWLACSDGRNKTCTSQWAEESFQDAMTWAYRNTDGSEVVEGSIVSKDYYETRIEVVQQRLAAAGVRLASTLQLALFDTSSLEQITFE